MATQTHEEIGRILREDLVAAQDRLRRSQEEFNQVFKNVPSGLPVPDGSFRLQRATLERRQTLQGLQMAVERHTKFVLYGIIPEDLLDG